MNINWRASCRIAVFTIAPRLVDSSGLDLGLLTLVVALTAWGGWSDAPEWD